MQRVGIWTATALIMANTVGSGIFTTTGFMARDIGSAPVILVLWAIGGVLALAGALTYAQLGLRWPRSGGEYIYITRTYGPMAGFLSGWTSFTLGFGAAIAASAVAFSHYFVILADQLLGQASAVSYIMDDDPTGSSGDSIWRHPAFIALCLVWTLTLFHSRSIAMSKGIQLLLTAVKLAFVLGFFTVAFGYGISDGTGNWGHFQSGDPGKFTISATCVALVFVMYSYSGWNAASYIAEEMDRPERTLPRAIVTATLAIILIYLFINCVYFFALPVDALAADPLLPVAEKTLAVLLGQESSLLFTAGLCFSIASAVSAMIWVGPRVYQKMALDGLAPELVGSGETIPTWSVVMQSVWVSFLVFSGTFEQLIIYAGVPLLLFSCIAVSCGLRLPAASARKAFLLYSPALFYVLITGVILVVISMSKPLETLLALLTVAAGVPIYYFYQSRK